MNRLAHIVVLFALAIGTNAQDAEHALREGNELFRANDLEGASSQYQEAISADARDHRASFNLGNSMYAKGDSAGFATAADRYEAAAALNDDPIEQARAYHNLGNAFMQQQQYQKALDAYKNALRRDPSDEETRYNLAYAQKMLKQQQEQQQKQDEENKDEENEEENEDEEKKDDQEKKDDGKDGEDEKEGENEDDKEGENEEQEKKDQGKENKEQEQKEQEQQQAQGMSKEDAERMLDALNYQEQQVQGKVLEQQQPANKIPIEKDW